MYTIIILIVYMYIPDWNTCINLIGNGNGKLWHAYTEGMHMDRDLVLSLALECT